MSPETLTAVFVAVGEIFAAVREALAKWRKDQAVAALPTAEAIDAHIRQLIAEALEHDKKRLPAPESPANREGPLAAGADDLKTHIDALVAEFMWRAEHCAPHREIQHAESPSDPTPPTAGAAPPEPVAGGVGPGTDDSIKNGPASP